MSRDAKLFRVYMVLLILSGLFFISLFLFLSDARKLHNEGMLRRPPHGPRPTDVRSSPIAPATIDITASTTPQP